MNSLKKIGMWGWFAVALVMAGLTLAAFVPTPAVEAGAEYWLAPWTWGRDEQAAQINAGLASMTSTVRVIFGAGLAVAVGATIISYRASAEKLKTAIENIAPASSEIITRLGALDERMTEVRREVREIHSNVKSHLPPKSTVSSGNDTTSNGDADDDAEVAAAVEAAMRAKT